MNGPSYDNPSDRADYYTKALRDCCPVGIARLHDHLKTKRPEERRQVLDWLWTRPLSTEVEQ